MWSADSFIVTGVFFDDAMCHQAKYVYAFGNRVGSLEGTRFGRVALLSHRKHSAVTTEDKAGTVKALNFNKWRFSSFVFSFDVFLSFSPLARQMTECTMQGRTTRSPFPASKIFPRFQRR